jgi:hypothetical protein
LATPYGLSGSSRCEQDAPEPILAAVLQEIEQAKQIDPCIKNRIGDRTADIHLRRMVAHHLWMFLAKHLRDAGVLYIEVMETRPRIHVLPPARGQVIDHRHVVTCRNERIHHVRADESGASGYENFHGPSLANKWRK